MRELRELRVMWGLGLSWVWLWLRGLWCRQFHWGARFYGQWECQLLYHCRECGRALSEREARGRLGTGFGR